MISVLRKEEVLRLQHPARPTRVQWLLWSLEDARGTLLWHVANAGIPAMLCRELYWLRQDWASVQRCAGRTLAHQLLILEDLSIESMELERVGPLSRHSCHPSWEE